VGVTVDELPFVAFTPLRNVWLRDRRISYKAKGLLGYLRSHAAGYRCSQAQMVRESDDGRAAVRSALDELETAGYLERTVTRDGGRYAETEYRMRDPFDAEGNLRGGVENRHPLPETAAPHAGEVSKIDQGRKSDMVTMSEKPTREIAPLEEQGEKNTPAPTEQGGAGGQLVLVDEPNRTRAKPRRRIPEDWQPSVGARANADQRFPGWEHRETVEEFRDYWIAAGRPMANWDQTWMNRVRDIAQRSSNGHRNRSEPYRNPPPGSYKIERQSFL
jgi:hypothetical protein